MTLLYMGLSSVCIAKVQVAAIPDELSLIKMSLFHENKAISSLMKTVVTDIALILLYRKRNLLLVDS